METVTVVAHGCPNPDIRVYTIDGPPLSPLSIFRLNRGQTLGAYDGERLDRVGLLGEALLTRLVNCGGIVRATLEPNQVSVEKAFLFDWQDIERKVLDVIQRTLNVSAIEIEHVAATGLREGWLPDRAPRLCFEEVPNQAIRRVHVNRLMTEAAITHLLLPVTGDHHRLAEVGATGERIALSLSALPALDELFLAPYAASVRVRDTRVWPTVEPALVETFRAALEVGELAVERKRLSPVQLPSVWF